MGREHVTVGRTLGRAWAVVGLGDVCQLLLLLGTPVPSLRLRFVGRVITEIHSFAHILRFYAPASSSQASLGKWHERHHRSVFNKASEQRTAWPDIGKREQLGAREGREQRKAGVLQARLSKCRAGRGFIWWMAGERFKAISVSKAPSPTSRECLLYKVNWGLGDRLLLTTNNSTAFCPTCHQVSTVVTTPQFSSVQFSCSVVCDSLRPHELQHSRPLCPSPTPRAYTKSCPLSHWCHPTISSSVVPFSSCPQSFPASGSFQMSQLFASGGQSIGISASTSVLPMNIQD